MIKRALSTGIIGRDGSYLFKSRTVKHFDVGTWRET